ncbi:MAG: hypothetical protein IKA57_05035 [Clostridia bacterium]|nr:hypothetical protein [Clostridia bacterium]
MKSRTKKFIWKLLCIIVGYLAVMLGVFFYALQKVKTETMSASADTVDTSPMCLTYGRTTVDGTTTMGCPDKFTVYMRAQSTITSDTIYNGNVSNWSEYYIVIDAIDLKEHLLLELYKGGLLYKSISVSGDEDITANFGGLSSGEYTLVYECRYKKNLFSSNVYYKYEYSFEVDIDKPTYSFGESSGTGKYSYYTNKNIFYSVSDANFSYIRYKHGLDGEWRYCYYNSLSILATEENNGFWFFQTYDRLASATDISERCIDTIAPVGKVDDRDGDVISNGGATKDPFIYSATDEGTIVLMEYKSPEHNTWRAYDGTTSIITLNGWYYFRTLDAANNMSDEFRVYYDTSKPIGQLYDANGVCSNGTITNKSYIKYEATDSESGISRVQVQKPGSRSFVSYINGSQLTAEGKYLFKALDAGGNETAEIQEITLDLTAPVGKLNVGGSVVKSGSYTSKPFSYTAADTVGVAVCQYKKPNSSEWLTYTQGAEISGIEGEYSFRSIDHANNVSEESKIIYDVSQPKLTLFSANIGGNGQVVESGSVIRSECIRATALDSVSGIKAIYVSCNGGAYSVYTPGTELMADATYSFYAINNALLHSSTSYITLDKTGPMGIIYCENTKWNEILSITGADFIRFDATDALSGVKALYVKRPGTVEYIECDNTTKFTEEGEYMFYAVDFSDNSSLVYTITVNHTAPKGELYINGQLALDNNGYTNADYISYIFNEGTGFVVRPNASSSQYTSGTTYSDEGKYSFWTQNEGGQASCSVVIDRSPKELTLTSVNNGYSKGKVEISWTNGNPDIDAPVDTITINGKLYEGGTIYTIKDAVYDVVCTDKAGNVWKTQFIGGARNLSDFTMQKVFWEVEEIWGGRVHSFHKYENALIFATSMEYTNIEYKSWTTATWDQGIPMDTVDSVNAKNGAYYLYKSEDDPEKKVAYFTQERLDEVVKKYAEKRVQSWYYWEKETDSVGFDDYLDAYPGENKIVGVAVELREGYIYTLDGEPYAELTVTEPDLHTLLMEDGYGGSVEYEIYIWDSAPTLQYALGENSPTNAEFDRIYYFSGKVTLSLPMEGDEFAMFVVYYENGDEVGCFDIENACTIEESGIYSAMAVNHYGETEEFKFVVSMNAPTITMTENAEKKTLDIAVGESKDKVSHISFLEIAKSDDGGETWIALTEDDYGKAITVDTLKYNFRTSGLYKVTVMDEFRTGIDALVQTISYEQPMPEATLDGVEHEGYTNKPVTFTWKDEVIVEVLKDGKVIEYTSGQKLTEDGFYKITFSNYNGYKKIYSFTIDTRLPVIVTEGANHREAVNKDVKVFYTEENLTAELYKDGKLLGNYVSGNPISADGQYRVRVYDFAGNEVSVEFTIDKTVEYEINVYNGGLSNSVVATSHETITTELMKNGEKMDYALGSAIVEPADYTLVLIDALGNKDVIVFRIIQPLVKEFTHNFDDVEGFGGVLVNGEDKRLNYGTLELFGDGKYDVDVIVGGETYSFKVTVDATAPTLVLNGVENGGSTKNGVTLSEVSEAASVKVYLDGGEIAYHEGDVLQMPGDYKIVVEDVCGNVNEYSFTIQKTLSGGVIALIVIGGVAFVGAIVFFILKKKKVF